MNDYNTHIDPEYPYSIVIPGNNMKMSAIDSPTSKWLRTKKYPYIVGGNFERHIFRFKEYNHAKAFAVKWK